VDEVTPEGALARSSADAPEIDGVVRIAPDARLQVGEFFDVRITATDAHDLQGQLI
jgi:ribosomal protein S12 methylthiotransferase